MPHSFSLMHESSVAQSSIRFAKGTASAAPHKDAVKQLPLC